MKVLAIIVALLFSASFGNAAVVVAESAYSYSNGGPATGTLTVSWPAFTSGATAVAAGSTTVAITAGVLSISLVANDIADPPVFYTAVFKLSRGSYSQQWVVPSVAGPLTISDVVRVSLSPITILPAQISKVGAVAGDIIGYNGTNWVRLPVGTNGRVLSVDTSLAGKLKWIVNSASGGVWGAITGTLTDQTDLASALSLKASSTHTHAAADVTSGVIAIARLATGTPTGSKFVRDDNQLAVPAGSGLSGPGSSTSNAVARWNGTAGDTLANSTLLYDGTTLSGAPAITVGDGTVAGSLSLYELSANGSNFRKWLVPDALTADLTMTHANAVPAAGQVMRFGAPSVNVSAQTWGDASGVGACASNTWASTLNNNAAPTCTQPAFSNLSGAATSAQLPNPGASSKGGINSKTCSAGDFVSTIGTDGSVTCTTPSGGGSSDPSVSYAYSDDFAVGSSFTEMCSLTLPGGTLGTGGAANSTGFHFSAYITNVTGNDAVYVLKVNSQEFNLNTAFNATVWFDYFIANNLSTATKQSITPVAFFDAGLTRTPIETAAGTDSTASMTLSIGMKAASGTTVHVFRCYIGR